MKLKKLNDKVYYYPHQPETDRPMLVYLKGGRITLAVDAGNSAAHVDEFYQSLEAEGFRKPDVTVLTHWHWDHTFGMHRIHGLSIAHCKTNAFLEREKARLSDDAYLQFLKKDDECLNREYDGNREIVIALPDIQFRNELTLNLGGMTARVFHAESPHSEDTVLIYVPEEKILFLGDSTSEDFYNDGYMDRGKLNSLIKLIESHDCDYCILSHTEPLTKTDLLQYLKSI